MVRELLDVGLLLGELLLELLELLLLALADRKVLLGALAALEGVTVEAGPSQFSAAVIDMIDAIELVSRQITFFRRWSKS